jgi:hypothetical protein
VGYRAKIIDSNGKLITKGKASTGGGLNLQFELPAGANYNAATGKLIAQSDDPAHYDQVQYFLKIEPAQGVDLSKSYKVELDVKVVEAAGTTIYSRLCSARSGLRSGELCSRLAPPCDGQPVDRP